MKCKTSFAAVTVLLTVFILADARIHAQSPIDIGSRKQLLIDDLFFETSHNVTLKIQPPQKTGEAVLTREHPWESATVNWFSVLQDQGQIDTSAKYRMWYEAYDIDGWPTIDDTSFCYAESRDGIHWTKPELGLFSFQGNTRNNILFRQVGVEGAHSRVHGSSVFIDPAAPASARYKAVSQGMFPAPPDYRIAGMFSSDGLKWTRHPQPICDVFADSQYSSFWDSSLGKYVLYGRVGGRGRSLGRSESSDFTQFDPLKLILQTDDTDPPNSDLYNSAAMKYPYADNVYLMFPSLYQHGPDTLDIRLAVSRDGIHWTRPDQQTPWIALGKPDEFDAGSLYMGQGIIREDNELWLYYSGSPLKHNEAELENLTQQKNVRIYSRVVTHVDRFVAATAGAGGGSFTTPPLRFTGETLRLNVRVHEGGRVQVGLVDEDNQPIPGRSIADCVPISGDSISVPVRWKSGGDIGFRAEKPTRLRVALTDAEVYSFQVVPRDSEATLVPVIFDTDIVGDVDDVGAVAVLHALADRGEARILATSVLALQWPDGSKQLGSDGRGLRRARSAGRYSGPVGRGTIGLLPCVSGR